MSRKRRDELVQKLITGTARHAGWIFAEEG